MSWLLSLLTDNPAIRALQLSLLGTAVVAVYLVFYATRDILIRTRSFAYQLVSIVLVAVLPVFGFFLYLLIRPASTVRERELEKMVKEVLGGKKGKKEKRSGHEEHKEHEEHEETAPPQQQ